MKRIAANMFLTSVLGVLIMLTSGCQRPHQQGSLEGSVATITIQGEGKAEAVPDLAIVRFGVASDGKTLDRTYSDNTRKMNAVIEAAAKKGIEPADMTTSGYNIIPVYPRDESGRQIPGKPVSFRVTQELTLKIRDLQKTGGIIDEVVSAGVNTFSGIQFTSGKLDELEVKARVEAAKNARENAEILADSLNVKLGRLIRVSQSSNRPYPVGRVMGYEMASVRSVPDIQAGTMEVTAFCDVVYEIIQ
jgi:uncharacterized protein